MIGKLIGEVARELGMNPRTLRYYEILRLLPIPPRSGGGYRLYDPKAIQRLGTRLASTPVALRPAPWRRREARKP